MKRIDFERERRIDHGIFIFALILCGLALLWLSSCKKPDEPDHPEPVRTSVFISKGPSSVVKYRFVYGMKGPTGTFGVRPLNLVYSSQDFELNKEYLNPLNAFDSIVKQ